MKVIDTLSYSTQYSVYILTASFRELDDPNIKSCLRMKGNETMITSEAGVEYDFVYDYSLWSVDPNHPEYIDQEHLYKLMAEPLVTSAFEGYNTCLFAYGQVQCMISSIC